MITYQNYLLLESNNKAALYKKYKDKIYIKKERQIGDFTVWIVDGDLIRDHVQEEFTNYSFHYRFSFIPKDEIWIDEQASSDESQFYIDRLLYQIKLIKNGMSYDKSYNLAD